MEAVAGGGFLFYRPNGSLIEPVPPLSPLSPDPVRALLGRCRREGLAITALTGYPTWDGEAVDYDWAAAGLQAKSGQMA